MIGQTLSHFKITAKLGEGGMGEVYLGEDTKLGREVAIKVLPEAFTEDPERFARFEREAHVLASLNHPNIAAIYDLAEDKGTHFLVLELAEGEDLAARLARGPVPIEEALPLALQIAEALEVAHDKGIVHRDLKPANVMVRPDGQAKVLDFGLAKAWEVEGKDSGSLSLSPTLTAQMTQAGTLLGTAAYMSPEQARGENADRRADIWAFGVVLMEMLTGKTVYAGKTVSDSLAGVLAREPEWDELPDETPAPVQRLLQRCMEKEVTERLQAIGEARIAINRYLTAPEAEEQAVALEVLTPAIWKRIMPWAVAGTLAIALGALLSQPDPAPAVATRATILAPEGTSFDLNWSSPGIVSVSPDGRSLAFSATDTNGDEILYIRDLEDVEARPLAGTEGAAYPFWSPDGRFVAFFGESKLKKVEKAGGPPITLAPATNGKGGTWSPAGVIVFAPTHESGLFRVAAAGGESTAITEIDQERFNGHRFPQFLPDGENFLFIAQAGSIGAPENRVMVGSIAGDAPVDLFATSVGPLYAVGHLFFLVEGTLMARPFDPDSLETTGEMFPVAENVVFLGGAAKAAFSISEGGTLAYHAGDVATGSALHWIDRGGVIGETFGETDFYQELRLSPDGRRAVVSIIDQESGNQDLWILDLERGLRDRFTFDEGQDWLPVWSPDGERIAFCATREDGGQQIYVKSVLTGDSETVLFEDETDKYLFSWSPDGRYLTYVILGNETSWDMYAIDLIDGGEPIPLQPSQFFDAHPIVSPDGRWLAYFTTASGQSEVYVTAFPAGGRKWQVSPDGGAWPIWDPSGTSLYWLKDEQLMEAEVDGSGEVFRIGSTSKIADRLQTSTPGPYPYDITPNGQRFLFNLHDEISTPPLTLVLDLQTELLSER